MKARTLVSIPIFVVVVAVIFIFASCSVTDDGDGNGGATPAFVGTWVNPDYDGRPGAKIVITDIGGNDYKFDMYFNHDDTEPMETYTATVTNQWTDSEGNLFVEFEGDAFDFDYIYVLAKIHADNQTMEANSSEVAYPTEIDPAGEDYDILYRQ